MTDLAAFKINEAGIDLDGTNFPKASPKIKGEKACHCRYSSKISFT